MMKTVAKPKLIEHDPPQHQRVAVASCEPNPWNTNVMSRGLREKLLRGIELVQTQQREHGVKAPAIPPIMVRPHPDPHGTVTYQIIDGEQRWTVLRDADYADIDVFVLRVDEQAARILTDTFNNLHGETDHDKYGAYLAGLQSLGMRPDDIAYYLPYSADEVTAMFEDYEIDIIEPAVLEDGVAGTGTDDVPDDAFVKLEFVVSVSQAPVVEAELARLGNLFDGKNKRGRALEFMAVNSSTTELRNLTGEQPNEPLVVETKKRTRKKPPGDGKQSGRKKKPKPKPKRAKKARAT